LFEKKNAVMHSEPSSAAVEQQQTRTPAQSSMQQQNTRAHVCIVYT
jgi:hypothetical protein